MRLRLGRAPTTLRELLGQTDTAIFALEGGLRLMHDPLRGWPGPWMDELETASCYFCQNYDTLTREEANDLKATLDRIVTPHRIRYEKGVGS